MRSGWRRLLGSVVLTVVVGAWVAWRSCRPEFAFLAGRKPSGPAWEVPDNLGKIFTGHASPRIHIAYVFKADAKALIAEADRQLAATGWERKSGYWPQDMDDQTVHEDNYVTYSERGGQERQVIIDIDCSDPSRMITSDIVVGAPHYDPGWISVTVTRSKTDHGWMDRLNQWLDRVFLGHP